MQIITLTTDFGNQDWFVGTMKGVILGINPRANIVDLTHEVRPGDVRGGALALSAACEFFPKGTIHVAVVDPGVGSERKAIAVRTEKHCFVGPDNGVLSFALRSCRIKAVHRLENADFFLETVSHTFHGRDVFAPVAAHLSRGVAIQELGARQSDLFRLKWNEPHVGAGGSIEGEVVYIDRFGNAITNVENATVGAVGSQEVFSRWKRLCAVGACYSSVREGEAVAVPGSSGFLEISVNGSSASKEFSLGIGDRISVRRVGMLS